MKDMCEAYLDQSDFLLAVRDATTLIDEFGLFFFCFAYLILESLNKRMIY